MQKRVLGSSGREVGRVGLGCMGMSWGYQESERDDAASRRVIRRALDLGVDFIDTAAVYGDGHNELLVGQALAGRRDDVVLATKGGLVVDDLAARAMHRDGSPAALVAGVHESLRRLQTEYIDLYYLHRVDDAVPVEESWGALAGLVNQGLIRWLALSEVDIATAERAHAVHPVTAIQSELSMWTRDALGTPSDDAFDAAPNSARPADRADDVVGWCADHEVAFVPYAPLGRGFLTGALPPPSELDDTDFRALNPRFQGEAYLKNQRIVDVVQAVAARHNASPAQVAIAWTLAQGEHVISIPGTKRVHYLEQNLGADQLHLTVEDLRELDGAPAAIGSRF